MRDYFRYSFFTLVTLLLNVGQCSTSLAADRPPNFVVIFTDDQGYADLSCFAGEHVSTPIIDQMACRRDEVDQLLCRRVRFARLRARRDDGLLSQTHRHGHGFQFPGVACR